jgi:hypothetical protein
MPPPAARSASRSGPRRTAPRTAKPSPTRRFPPIATPGALKARSLATSVTRRTGRLAGRLAALPLSLRGSLSTTLATVPPPAPDLAVSPTTFRRSTGSRSSSPPTPDFAPILPPQLGARASHASSRASPSGFAATRPHRLPSNTDPQGASSPPRPTRASSHALHSMADARRRHRSRPSSTQLPSTSPPRRRRFTATAHPRQSSHRVAVQLRGLQVT